MEPALPSSSESGLGEVDSSTISVVVDGKEKKRKPQSKYNDEDRYKIAKYAKGHVPNQAARCFQSKYPTIRESTVRIFFERMSK